MSWVIFLCIWFLFIRFLLSEQNLEDKKNLKISVPTFKESCLSKKINCINDCSFLCVENDVECVGGVCEIVQQKIPCEKDTGGLLMMLNDPTPRWQCICTNSTFFTGPNCNQLNPDVCENGTFFYSNAHNYYCSCFEPYEKFELNGKPYCLPKIYRNFLYSRMSNAEIAGKTVFQTMSNIFV